MSRLFENIRRFALVTGMLAIACAPAGAQVIAYFNMGAFDVPGQQPFVETYLTIVGSSLSHKKTNGQYQGSVNVALTILKDTTIVKANKYNLNGPLYNDTLQIPAFIDNQRYPVDNGIYVVHVVISDINNPKNKPVEFRQKFVVAFNNNKIQCSTIEALESYKKAAPNSLIAKSGVDLIPYNVNYYPETQKELAFYLETYNTDTVLGRNQPFVYYY
jgi:hypothetical protein